MKKTWITHLSAAGLTAVLAAGCSQPEPAPPAKPMHSAIEKLDLEGDLVVYMNTSGIEQKVLEMVDTMAEAFTASATPGAPGSAGGPAAPAAGFDQVKEAIEWSGLLSLKSLAISSSRVEGDMSRIISMAGYDPADGDKPLWRILSGAPRELAGMRYVPDDAVYVANSTASLPGIYSVVNEAVKKFLPAEGVEQYKQKTAMIESEMGVELAAIFGALEDEMLVAVMLSETETMEIPQGMMKPPLTIPEPSVLFGLKVNEAVIGKLILTQLASNQVEVVETTHGAYTIYSPKVPAQPPLQPSFVEAEDYLLLGSSAEVLIRALDSRSGDHGLLSTDLYKKLLAKAPARVSGIEFLSPRFMKTYMDVMTESMGPGLGGPEAEQMMKVLDGFEELCVGTFMIKQKDGLYSESLANYGGSGPVELMATSYIGLLSAVALPSFMQAREAAGGNACQNNLRMLDAAKEMWAIEQGKAAGATVAETDVAPYLRGAALPQCPSGASYTLNPLGTPPECAVHGPLY